MSKTGETVIVRNVCEVDDKLYQAFRQPRRRPNRTRVSHHFAAFPDDRSSQYRADSLDLDAADIEAHARAAADEVENKLNASDPIAGIGDPAAAWRTIERLPMGVLLATLDLLEQRGHLDWLSDYRQQEMATNEHSKVDIAFHVRALHHSDAADAHISLQDTASKLAYLDVQGRHDAYRYLMGKQSLSRELETLLEGFMAFEFAHVTWQKPVIEAGLSVGAFPPEPIGPGPWAKPPDEPAELYIGKAAHREIAHYYRMLNSTDIVYVNHRPIYVILEALRRAGLGGTGKSLTLKEGAMQPDIVNISKMYIYEIKPSGRVVEAGSRVALYLGILQKAGVSVSLGPPGAPGTTGYVPAPGGVFIFSSPAPGIITYDYRRGAMVPVEIPQGQESESKSWTWELQPIRKEQEHMFVVTIVVTMVAVVMAVATAPFSS